MPANDVVASVANGHAFAKHAAEFSDPALGRVHPVQTPQDLGVLIQDILNDPSTKAISKGDGSLVYMMNKNHNVIIALNESADPKSFGAGTVFKSTEDIEQKFSKLSKSLGDNSIKSQNIQEVNAMVDRFEQTIARPSTKNHMAQADTKAIAGHLDQRASVNGLIIGNSDVLNQHLEADVDARRQVTQSHQDNANLRRDVEVAATHPDSIVDIAQDGKSAMIMDAQGNAYDVKVNTDNTVSVVSELADGAKSEVVLSERQSLKLAKAIPDLKGMAEIVVVPLAVASVALATGSSPAGVIAGGAGGCAAGHYIVGKAIDGGKAVVGAVMDYFGGDDETVPQGVINHGTDLSAVLPDGVVLTIQSSGNDAGVTRGVIPDNQIKVMSEDGQSSSTLVEMDRQRAMDQLRAAELAAAQQQAQQSASMQMTNR